MELNARDTTRYRAIAARANYLAADRPDLMYAVKELCRGMAKPTELHWNKLKRLGRYLLGHKRMVYAYPFQRADGIDVYSDTDWSGCPRTRKSTSGGCIMIGSHCIQTFHYVLLMAAEPAPSEAPHGCAPRHGGSEPAA